MFFLDSDNEFEIDPEEYYGHEYLDYMFDDVYDDLYNVNALYDTDYLGSEDDDYDEASYKSAPPEEELNQMKRCLAICTRMNEDRKEGLFCDATILIEGKAFPVNKNVLKASSSYFSAMFMGSFTEKDKDQVQIQGVSPETFSLILDFMYGAAIKLTFENVKEIYMAGDMLCMDALIADCKAFIKNNWVTSDNVQAVYEMAKQFDMNDVTEEILHHARVNLVGFMGATDFRDLPFPFLQSVLDGRQSLLQMQAESSMAHNILRWIFFKPHERLAEMAPKLLTLLHFEFVTETGFEELLKFVSSQKETVSEEELKCFEECLRAAHHNSHQRWRELRIALILPSLCDVISPPDFATGSSDQSNVWQDFKVHVYGSEGWKWATVNCSLTKPPLSYVVSDEDLYIFTSEGCTGLNLKTQTVVEFPPFPEKRKRSVFAVMNGAIYATGGVKENSSKLLGDILLLKPSSMAWLHTITWRKPKCDASSILHGQNIYFVGGKNYRDQQNWFSECFMFNTLTRYFKRICKLSYSFCQPHLCIYGDVLYIFSSERDHFRKTLVERVDLKSQTVLPTCELKGLDPMFPILAVCSLDEGILIAQSFDKKILLSLYHPSGVPERELLGCVSLPCDWPESKPSSKCKVLFYLQK